MAAQELTDLVMVLERYPERRAELVEQLGAELLAEVEAARAILARAAARLDETGGKDPVTPA